MKKNRRRFFLTSVLAAIIAGLMLRQTAWADFQTDYQNFLKIYENYRSAHTTYLSTQNRYLQFGTLASKSEALDAVKSFIAVRDDALIGYLVLLRERNVDPSFNTFFDQENAFLADHKSRVDAVGSLEDAVLLSKDVEKRHLLEQNFSKKIIGTAILKKVQDFKDRFIVLENDAEALIAQLRAKGFDVTTQERWLLDAKNKRLFAEQKIVETNSLISQLKISSVAQLTSDYNKIQFSTFEANQYLREGNSFLTELANSIKYGKF